MTENVPDQTPACHEDDLSQIPALLLLRELGYEDLTPDEALKLGVALAGARVAQDSGHSSATHRVAPPGA